MNMALQAYARAATQGFTEPRSSRVAKDDWRLQSDAVVQWLAECEMAEGAYLGVKPCYDAFCSWSASVGLSQTPTLKTFSQRVERQGIEKRRMAQGVVFMGLKTAPAQERG